MNYLPVYANISFYVDYGIVLNDIYTIRPSHRLARIFTYNDFIIMIKAISHQIMNGIEVAFNNNNKDDRHCE